VQGRGGEKRERARDSGGGGLSGEVVDNIEARWRGEVGGSDGARCRGEGSGGVGSHSSNKGSKKI
jgi:hypothetical protein